MMALVHTVAQLVKSIKTLVAIVVSVVGTRCLVHLCVIATL